MRYQIQALSRQAAETLSGSGSGTIHSVYRHTVNLQLNGQLFSLQPEGSVLSPISLITELDAEAFPRLCAGLTPDKPATFRQGVIHLTASGRSWEFVCRGTGTACVEMRLACRLTDTPRASGPDRLKAAISEILSCEQCGFAALFPEILTVQKDAESTFEIRDVKTDPRILSAAATHIRRSLTDYRSGNKSGAAEDLLRLLGLGIGLTPSGDDFLCGVLAGCELRGIGTDSFSEHLKHGIAANLDRTPAISAAFLACAIQGCFSEPVLELAACPEREEICRRFRAIGHSSGFDTLCGILYGLSLPTKKQSEGGAGIPCSSPHLSDSMISMIFSNKEEQNEWHV